MTTTKPTHTPEPWTAIIEAQALTLEPANIYADTGGRAHVAEVTCGTRNTRRGIGRPETDANANRIVACVNGCKGINPEAVPGLVAALERVVEYDGHMADEARDRGLEADVRRRREVVDVGKGIDVDTVR